MRAYEKQLGRTASRLTNRLLRMIPGEPVRSISAAQETALTQALGPARWDGPQAVPVEADLARPEELAAALALLALMMDEDVRVQCRSREEATAVMSAVDHMAPLMRQQGSVFEIEPFAAYHRFHRDRKGCRLNVRWPRDDSREPGKIRALVLHYSGEGWRILARDM